MRYLITAPRALRADVPLPASKSISARALIISALAGGAAPIHNLSDCDDTRAVLAALGGTAAADGGVTLCQSQAAPDGSTVDVGAAGTAMRFLTAYYAATPGATHTLTGTERMRHRPIGILVDALRDLGADIAYLGEEGFPPLRVRGRHLQGGTLEVAGDTSSQYISALLLIAPALQGGLELKMTGDIVSRPYIDLTLWLMRESGADADWTDSNAIAVKPRPYTAAPRRVESDWSAASYWYEMAALCPGEVDVRLRGLGDSSKQGDSMVRYLFSMLGVKTVFERPATPGAVATVRLTKSLRQAPKMDYDFKNVPDLAQTVVAACAALGKPFHFWGLGNLRIKETDRIAALAEELGRAGYAINDDGGDTISWDGARQTPAGEPFRTHEDHRMAMCLAPLAMLGQPVSVQNPEVVSKSYPLFWQHLRAAGFGVEEETE